MKFCQGEGVSLQKTGAGIVLKIKEPLQPGQDKVVLSLGQAVELYGLLPQMIGRPRKSGEVDNASA